MTFFNSLLLRLSAIQLWLVDRISFIDILLWKCPFRPFHLFWCFEFNHLLMTDLTWHIEIHNTGADPIKFIAKPPLACHPPLSLSSMPLCSRTQCTVPQFMLGRMTVSKTFQNQFEVLKYFDSSLTISVIVNIGFTIDQSQVFLYTVNKNLLLKHLQPETNSSLQMTSLLLKCVWFNICILKYEIF